MKKTILLIDAGYLLIVLREEGTSYNANMIAQIAKDCCVADEEELHKILYYDCDSFDPIDKKTGKPFFYLLKHKNGAELVKKSKPKFRQKGVDMRIGLDMAHLAHQGKIDRIILITADTDFIPAMKYVRKANIQVVIAKLGERHLTPDLTMHTDFIRPIKLTKYH